MLFLHVADIDMFIDISIKMFILDICYHYVKLINNLVFQRWMATAIGPERAFFLSKEISCQKLFLFADHTSAVKS